MLTNSQGQRINPPFMTGDIRHPDNIEAVWSDEELAAIGLFRAPDPEPEPPPPPGVPDISDRQFFQMLAMVGIITPAEALAAVKTGEIPAPMQAIVDTIPDAGQRFAAEMVLSGATVFQRNHPLTLAFAAQATNPATGNTFTAEEVDALFWQASEL